MNHWTFHPLALVTAAMLVSTAAQAQNVIVINSPDAAAARAALQASIEAAKRGKSVGMVTGRTNPLPERQPNGAVAYELDASTMMFSVARVGTDGQIERVCINSAEAAEKAAKAPVFAQRFTPRAKEQINVTK